MSDDRNGAAGGFDVHAPALETFARSADGSSTALKQAATASDQLYLPPEAFGRVRRSAAVHRAFLDVVESGADALTAVATDLADLSSGIASSGRSYTADDETTAASYLGLPQA